MSTKIRFGVLCAALLLGLATHAAQPPDSGPVSVEFVNPMEFTDIKEGFLRTDVERNPHLRGLRKHLQRRAARYLQPGQTLQIAVTDIDLAGDHLPHSNPALLDIRTVTNLYPPRMNLNYTLKDASGSVIRSGEAKLRDLGFDIGSGGGSVSDPLRYEKRMFDKWLRKEFGGQA